MPSPYKFISPYSTGNSVSYQNVCNYSFNGTDEYHTYGDILDSTLSGATPQFTVEFWLKRGSIGTTQRIFSKWSGQGNDRGLFLYFNGSDNLVFTKSNNGSATQGNTSDNAFTNTTDYIYIAITYDGTVGNYMDAVKMYVNGTLETNTATTSTMSGIFATSQPLLIGTSTSGAGALQSFFDGNIRDIAISSDVKSASYILSRYNVGNMSAPSSTNLELHSNYKTDTFSTNWVVKDLSTNANDGASVNMIEGNRTCENIEILQDVI